MFTFSMSIIGTVSILAGFWFLVCALVQLIMWD